MIVWGIPLLCSVSRQIYRCRPNPQVEKELKEIHQISKDSMNEVRTIVENLKSRTLASELETVQKMLEIAGIETRLTINWTRLV